MEAIKELIQFAANNRDDSKDYIKEVSNIVKTNAHKGVFEKVFKQWVVASVANLYEPDKNTNPKCLVLCGGQGTGKTSFWMQLFTPSHYYFSGHVNLQDRDSSILLTDTFFVILDDQFITLQNAKEWDDLKKLVTMPTIRVRKHYQKEAKTYNRIANFCGASNLLAKSIRSCNNTFIPFELTETIDINKLRKIPIHKMWGQAYKLYQEGFLNQ